LIKKFQSTRPRGARLERSERETLHFKISIHAPARGATSHDGHIRLSQHNFNPRARAGRDVD